TAILVLTFLLYPVHRRFMKRVNAVDLAFVAAAVAITAYVFLNFETVIYRVNNPNQWDFVFGVIAIVTVLEAGRRTIGWHLPAIGIAAIAYAYFADFMPGPFRGPPKDLDYIVSNQYLGLDGMLGTPLQVAATFIILFTIYGAVLDYTGAGKFYVDLAFALTGKRPTGAARTVTVASFLHYLGILLPIEIDARRLGARAIALDAPGFWDLTKRYWYQYTSLFAIIVFLVAGFSTITAVFWSIIVAILVSYIRRETSLSPRKLVKALAAGTKQVLPVGATTAVAGIAVGILLQTGLG